MELIQKARQGEQRSIARLISLAETDPYSQVEKILQKNLK